MAYRIHNIGLWLDEPESAPSPRAAEKLGVGPTTWPVVRVVRSVLDARKKGSPATSTRSRSSCARAALPARLPPGRQRGRAAPAPPPPGAHAGAAADHRRHRAGGAVLRAGAARARRAQSILLERGREVVPAPQGRREADARRHARSREQHELRRGRRRARTPTASSPRASTTRMVRKVIETFAQLRRAGPHPRRGQAAHRLGPAALRGGAAARGARVAGGCEVRFETRVEDLLYGDGRVAGVRLLTGRTLDERPGGARAGQLGARAVRALRRATAA